MRQLLAALLITATIPQVLWATDAAKDPVAPTETNALAAVYFLPTNQPSFFCGNNRTGATYMKFAPDGSYEVSLREHMGVLAGDTGRWVQATNGEIALTSARTNRSDRAQRKVIPMTYRARTFLIWPAVSYKGRLQQACKELDTGKAPAYYEFMISAEQFNKGTAKPYPFKYRKELNKMTGAEE